MHSVGLLAIGDGWRPTPFLGCQVASGTRPLRMASWLRRWTQPMAPWRLCPMCIPGFRQPNAGANISRRKATSRSRYYRYSRQGTEHQRRIEKLLLLMMLIPSRRQAMPTMWIRWCKRLLVSTPFLALLHLVQAGPTALALFHRHHPRGIISASAGIDWPLEKQWQR